MTNPALQNNWVALGVITGAHGVRGQVKLRSFTEPAKNITTYALQRADGTLVKLRVEGVVKDQLIVSIDAIADRNEAERWRGVELGTPQENLPNIQNEKEFYHTELIGMKIVDSTGIACGSVKQVVNYGAGDLLEIEHAGNSEFYSFIDANFPHIDRAKRIITFHPPEILSGKEEA